MAREKWDTILGVLLVVGLVTSAVPMATAEPRRGGSVTWFIATDPGRLDPHMPSSPGAQQAVAGIYSSLLQYDPTHPTELIPDLAERWDMSPDGTVYTFYLRPGVKWHDGTTFSAADVLSTFTRLRSPELSHSPCGTSLSPVIERIEALDNRTVRFHLKTPAGSFLPLIASGWCPIVARHILEQDAEFMQVQSQIGTGPFTLKQYRPGDRIEWGRNPLYYDPHLPYLDSVTQLILPHPARQLTAAQFGQVDLWASQTPMSQRQAMELKQTRSEDIELYQQPLNTVWTIQLNASKAPFNNREMRRAVHLALDRRALFEAAFAGAGVPCAILDPIVYGDWALPLEEIHDLPGCRQPKSEDLAEAQRLVAAHYPNGVTVDTVVLATGNYLERTQLVGAQLRKIGIQMRIKVYEVTTAERVYRKRQYAMIGTQDATVPISDPSAPFSLLFASKAPHNWVRWEDQSLDHLIQQGLQEQDAVKRRDIYHQIQRYVLTADGPTVTIGWIAGWFFHDKRVQDVRPARMGYSSPALMRVWLRPSETELQALVVEDTQRQDTELIDPSLSDEDLALEVVSTPEREASSEVLQHVVSLIQRTFPDRGAFGLQVSTDKSADDPYFAGEKLRVHIRTEADAYLEVDYYQADGQVVHLLPHPLVGNDIKAGERFTLGQSDSTFHFVITPPFGVELLTVVASEIPLPKSVEIPTAEPASIYLTRLAQRLDAYKAQGKVAVAFQNIRTQPRASVDRTLQEPTDPSIPPSISEAAPKRPSREAIAAEKQQDFSVRRALDVSVTSPSRETVQEKRVPVVTPIPDEECLLKTLLGKSCDTMPR